MVHHDWMTCVEVENAPSICASSFFCYPSKWTYISYRDGSGNEDAEDQQRPAGQGELNRSENRELKTRNNNKAFVPIESLS